MRVSWCHDDHVREHAHVRDIEDTVVRRTVGPGEAGTIHEKGNGQILERHLLKNLIETTLQECAVNIDNGSQPRLGLPPPRTQRHAIRISQHQRIDPGTRHVLAQACSLGTWRLL